MPHIFNGCCPFKLLVLNVSNTCPSYYIIDPHVLKTEALGRSLRDSLTLGRMLFRLVFPKVCNGTPALAMFLKRAKFFVLFFENITYCILSLGNSHAC